MANKCMKAQPMILVIQEMQIKASMKYQNYKNGQHKQTTTKRKPNNTKCWQGCGATESLMHCQSEHKMV